VLLSEAQSSATTTALVDAVQEQLIDVPLAVLQTAAAKAGGSIRDRKYLTRSFTISKCSDLIIARTFERSALKNKQYNIVGR
jgi:hypothetical protein